MSREPVLNRFHSNNPGLLDLFGDWTDPQPELSAMIEPGSVLRSDVYRRATHCPCSYKAKVAVLGGAAHAMTPHMAKARARRSRTP